MKIINWSGISRHITKGDRGGIRQNKIPKKHITALDKLFNTDLPKWWAEHKDKDKNKDKNNAKNQQLDIAGVSGSLPSVDEAGVMAVKVSEMVEPPLTAQEQAFFIVGFCECVKWLGSNDR